MPTPADTLTLTVAGQTHADWKSYRIDSDLLTPADAWQFTLGGGKRLPAGVVPGAAVEVRMGDDVVMRGVLDEIPEDCSKQGHTIELSGRDLAGQLLDCAAPIFTAEQIALRALVNKIVAPFGIKDKDVRIDAAESLTRTKVNVEPGDTAWDALQRAAEANGLWPWFDPSGVLVVGRPDYTSSSVGTLILRQADPLKNNVLSARRTRSLHDVFSEVAVLGQTPGTVKEGGKHGILARTYARPPLNRYRPKFVTDHECDTPKVAKLRASKLMSDGLLNADGLVLKVRGHRSDSGVPWTPGQRVLVTIDPFGLDGELWFVMARSFSGGRDSGTVTELTLKPDGVWQIEAHPHKATHRRGKNAQAVTVVTAP